MSHLKKSFFAVWTWGSFLCLAGVSTSTFAFESSFLSPRRDSGVSYQAYYDYYYSHHTKKSFSFSDPDPSVLDRSLPFSKADTLSVAQWPLDEATLQKAFEKIRDLRFIQDRRNGGGPEGMMRRSSWLYPDEGCFARAQLASENLVKFRFPIPSKVFVFGDLELETSNSPEGRVRWWYHVAPAYRIGLNTYILDPSVNPERPLLLQEWISLMTQFIRTTKISVCNARAYFPSSSCAGDETFERGLADQFEYLADEWQRLIDLNRDPFLELGDFPPWLMK